MLSSNVEPDHPGSLTLQLPSGPSNFTVEQAAKGRKITSFSSWMEAWNVYLAIRVDFAPSSAPSLIAYIPAYYNISKCVISAAVMA